jgi:O-antigen/teichoic acid export membrane protein
MRFKTLAKAKIIGAGLSGATGISMALSGFGVWSLVTQTIIGRFVPTVYYWVVSSWKPKLQFHFKAIRELWSYSLSLLIAGIIDTIYRQLDTVIIARIFTTTDLGLFSKAKSLNQFAVKYSSQSIDVITFPALSKIKNERTRLIETGLKAEVFIAFITFCLLGWLFVSSESLILTLLGQKWEASVQIFRLLCLSGFVYPVSSASLNMLKASGDSKSFLKVEVIKKIIGLIGLSIGFMFGLKGYLISLIITGMISVLLNMLFTSRSLNISIGHQLLPILPYVLLGIISSLIVEIVHINFRLQYVNFILITIAFFCVYFALNYLIKTDGIRLFIVQMNKLKEIARNKFLMS